MDDFFVHHSFLDLDNFQDLSQLVDIATKRVEKEFPEFKAHLFVDHPNYCEYREVIKEGTFSIPNDSLLVSYLTMKNSLISMKELEEEVVFQEEEILRYLLVDHLKLDYLVPVVYRYRLLGILGLASADDSSNQKKEEDAGLSSEHVSFFTQFIDSLHVNLYAAIQIDQRIHEHLSMTELAVRVKEMKSYDQIADAVLELMEQLFPFSGGVYYEYDEFSCCLIPRVSQKATPPEVLPLGRSLSGYVLEKRKHLFVVNLQENLHFKELNREEFLNQSVISIPLISDKHTFGVITLAEHGRGRFFSRDQLYMARIFSAILLNEMTNKVLYEQLEDSYLQTIITLTKTLDAKDPYTLGHSERVMKYSVGVATQLGLSPDKVNEIRYGAMLHDIGKIGVSDKIINKPSGLNAEEFEYIKQHTKIGAEIIESVHFLATVKELVKYHHEKMDGSGYHGKQGGEYPWETMIISLADIFDALTSDRPYRSAVTPEEAFDHIYSLKEIHFKEKVILAFMAYLKEQTLLPADYQPGPPSLPDSKLDSLKD